MIYLVHKSISMHIAWNYCCLKYMYLLRKCIMYTVPINFSSQYQIFRSWPNNNKIDVLLSKLCPNVPATLSLLTMAGFFQLFWKLEHQKSKAKVILNSWAWIWLCAHNTVLFFLNTCSWSRVQFIFMPSSICGLVACVWVVHPSVHASVQSLFAQCLWN